MESTRALKSELRWWTNQVRAPRLRTLREFAEEEIVIPKGKWRGFRFSFDLQPYTKLLFDAIDSGFWTRIVATGPRQSGKTLSAFVIPTLYHLFEYEETVVLGLPTEEMAADKWREDLLPVIDASRYRELLPKKGAGSRGGKVDAIQFRNGRTLKLLTGGGSDKSRAGYTSRVLCVTETDGMDESGRRSREADKVTQFEACTMSWGERARVYLECTVSIKKGRTWREFEAGSASRIALPCPHCSNWVSPERQHLVGWKEAESEPEAREAARFVCPSCGAPWSEEERAAANSRGVLVHRGQEVAPDGTVTGPRPKTRTLGFRWSPANNLFLTAADIAAAEWSARRDPDEDNAERKLCQFVWALPWEPSGIETQDLEPEKLIQRIVAIPRGKVPDDTLVLTAGVDVGRWLLHWVVMAWRPAGGGHVVDYGRVEVASRELPEDRALQVALQQLAEAFAAGWPFAERQGTMQLSAAWLDAGYQTHVIYEVVRRLHAEGRTEWLPALGRGTAQEYERDYYTPKGTGAVVKYIGLNYHISLTADRVFLVEVWADRWKAFLSERLRLPLTSPEAITFYRPALANEHLGLAHHLAAERVVEEYVQGRGVVRRFERIRRANHYGDAAYNACAAAHFAGAPIVPTRKEEPTAAEPVPPSLRTPDGRPYFVLER